MRAEFTRTLKLKVKPEAYPWLKAAACEVNQVWNYCNEVSHFAATRGDRLRKWMTGFDLCNLTAGATEYFDYIGAGTIQRVCTEYASKRRTAKRPRLRWRISRGAHRSLGWVPLKGVHLRRKGVALRFCGKNFRVFERERLDGAKWRDGCFAQDAMGDWWLCLPVRVESEGQQEAANDAVGIDLGLKAIAVTSAGERLEAGKFFRDSQRKIGQAQRRGHKRHAKRLYRRTANRRRDALHKFSRMIVNRYQRIFVGDVSSRKLVRTQLAKSVLDSGWGMLKMQLLYKCEYAGRSIQVVSERNTTRTCSNCGSLSGPTGLSMLVVRQWECVSCGEIHDRDVNAAQNILAVGLRMPASIGNESLCRPRSAEPISGVRQ